MYHDWWDDLGPDNRLTFGLVILLQAFPSESFTSADLAWLLTASGLEVGVACVGRCLHRLALRHVVYRRPLEGTDAPRWALSPLYNLSLETPRS